MPDALNRFEMFPATSMRIMWKGTPSAPGRRSVVSAVAHLLEADAEAATEHVDVVALLARRLRGRSRTA